MKMNEFMTALQTHLATQQPNYPIDAESILEVLFDAYNESSGFDNAAIKADFEELYRLMNRKPLKEIDEIIYAVCTLCRDHEKTGFIEGVKVGMSLTREINIPFVHCKKIPQNNSTLIWLTMSFLGHLVTCFLE